MKKVVLNDYAVEVDDYKVYETNGRTHIQLEFKVSHEDYHDVTTLLYQNNFKVEIPSENVSLQATIYKYWTSVTNLYKKGNVGQFHLELIEKK
ncbi:DUF3219 family protein [Aquisalibacillus elongatus]|uniref:Uncharacterized protein DUF3219 n=1 Tax=Aquisalibacillus elongatus TaxID=485577 RepID=A0A3N5BD29_9BACI|nr:DUF3219 family protein [Aquisalibacillus elongatus]RPF55337.1 uncharacterized protein DUF3219 [Aquisalibacillus elongatus]